MDVIWPTLAAVESRKHSFSTKHMAAPNDVSLPLMRKKGKMGIESLGHEGTSYVKEPWGKFSLRDVPGIENPHTLLGLFLLYW